MKNHYKMKVLMCGVFKNYLKISLIVFISIFTVQAQAQQITVTGTVRDDQGITLPGVSVLLNGTTEGTVTNADGKFSISVPNAQSVLTFKYLGFVDQQITVGSTTSLNVVLATSSTSLNEIVIVGYGTQKKSDVTGAIVGLDTKDLETMPQVNIQQALQGRIAGLTATTLGASAEGGNLNLQIRGKRTLGSTDKDNPLIVLDGVIFGNSLSEINPQDIESLQVLKDASSAAIYGSRAANGVILITTKKGKTGKARITYNTYYGTDDAINIPDLMSGERFYQIKKERLGAGEITTTEQNSFDNGISTDWVDLALRRGTRQEHNLSVSGGTEDTHYFISGTINTNKGISKNDEFNRYNLRLNLDSKIGKSITIGTNTQLGLYDRSGQPASFSNAFAMNPLAIPFEADGSIRIQPWPEDPFFANPLEGLNVLNNDLTRAVTTNNFVQIDFPFLKGLSYRLNTGYTYRNQSVETYRGQNTRSGFQNKGESEIDNSNVNDWLIDNIITYDRTIGKHTLGFTGLYSAQQREYSAHNVDGTGFISDIQTFYQNSTATTLTAEDNYDSRNNIGQMARLNYSYDSKYLLTATVRRDGYSAFGSDTKYGVFPSIGLGWNISQESFMKDLNWIESLKIRATYGENGNQAINPYATLPQLSQQNYLDNNKQPVIGYYPNRLGDPSLGWETKVERNLGVDYSFFRGRISGSIDYYNSRTNDILLSRSISPVNGIKNITQNIGKVKNKGIDFLISSVNINKSDFIWTTDFNISTTRSEILNVGLTDENGNPTNDVASGWFIGEPINVNYNYAFDGIWQVGDDIANSAQPTAKPGDVRIKDISGDNVINADDRTFIGSAIPDYIAGLTNTFTYKNLSLSFFIRSVQGLTRSNPLLNNFFSGREGVLDRIYWTAENPINTYPANRDDANFTQTPFFDEKTSDASFIRLQDVSLSYTLPSSITSRIKLDRLQLFLNAKNLATSTTWIGTDPEFDSQTSQPQVRSFIFGLRTQF